MDKESNMRNSIPSDKIEDENTSMPNRQFKYIPSSNKWNRDFAFGKHSQRFSYRDDHSYGSNMEKHTKNISSEEKYAREYSSKKYKSKNFYRKKKEASEFRFGNYHQYYGYRNQGQIDSRILCMKKEWFSGKDVLDVGCNAGHFTLTIAKDFSPRSIIGIDIDNDLVKMATRNVRHYVSNETICDEDFPISLVLNYGPVAQAMDPKDRYPPGNFPFNVQFLQGNYILPSDELLEEQQEFFDTVLCLSLTKWIHLNWGDVGIKRLFFRIYNQLRPKGHLILEAQSYQSYAKRKRITEEVFKHYSEIELFPEMFNEYLIKKVGFETCELIDTPAHSSQGFSRPIYLFTKSGHIIANTERKAKHVIYNYSSDSCCDDSEVEQISD